MPRKSNIIKKSLPPLFKRGKKRIYSFRFLNSLGKDKWISTETSDLEKAKLIQFTFFEKNVAAKASLNIEKTPDKIAGKLTKAIYEDITGKKESRMKIADIHENWIEFNSDYKDLSKSSKDYCKTIFKMFSAWCNSGKISDAEGVTLDGAKRYSNK